MKAWETFLTQLENELGVETVRKWLRPLKMLRFDACNLYLEAKDNFQVLWFEEHIKPKTYRLLNNNNKRIKVHLNVANSDKTPKPVKKNNERTAPPLPKFTLGFDLLDPYCTFENFVISAENTLTYKLMCKVSGYNPETGLQGDALPELGAFNPIYIHGGGGSGKTHLLMAAAYALQSRGMNVLYARSETFTEHVVTAIRAGEMSTFRQAYRNSDVLILDDVHVFSRKGATQEELFHTFNTLHLSGKQIILSANCPPSELQMIEPRLTSRFEWGILLSLDQLNKEEIAAVLKKKSKALNFPLHPKTAEFLQQTFPGTKSLHKALQALILRSHLNEHKITSTQLSVAHIRHLLSDLIKEEEQSALTPNKIIQSVAESFGIRTEDITGKGQTRDCVLPRQISMHLCRTELKIPFTKIGEIFNKDHSTVMSSVKAIQKMLDQNDTDITTQHQAILKKLRN